jgi:hypothetical protein
MAVLWEALLRVHSSKNSGKPGISEQRVSRLDNSLITTEGTLLSAEDFEGAETEQLAARRLGGFENSRDSTEELS